MEQNMINNDKCYDKQCIGMAEAHNGYFSPGLGGWGRLVGGSKFQAVLEAKIRVSS